MSESFARIDVLMNYRLRKFQDDLVDLINSYDDLPWEARLLALELIAGNVQKQADMAVMSEMSEKEEQCRKHIQE